MFIVYRLKKTHKSEEKATKLNAQLERWFELNCSAPPKKQTNKQTNMFFIPFLCFVRQ